MPGDGARRDEDGYYWVTGRTDDVLIGATTALARCSPATKDTASALCSALRSWLRQRHLVCVCRALASQTLPFLAVSMLMHCLCPACSAAFVSNDTARCLVDCTVSGHNLGTAEIESACTQVSSHVYTAVSSPYSAHGSQPTAAVYTAVCLPRSCSRAQKELHRTAVCATKEATARCSRQG